MGQRAELTLRWMVMKSDRLDCRMEHCEDGDALCSRFEGEMGFLANFDFVGKQ